MKAAALAFACAGLLLTSCTQPSHPSAPQTLVIDKMAYGPAPPNLHEGDTLVWANHDILLHSATATDGSFNVDIPPGASRSVKLTHAGTIDVYCRYHPDMKVRLMVEPQG